MMKDSYYVAPGSMQFTTTPISVNTPALSEGFECNQNLWDVFKGLDPEVQQMMFTDYPQLKAYWIRLTQAYQGTSAEVLMIKNTDQGIVETLVQKHDGTVGANGKYTGSYILQDAATGFEILHNTYADGVRTSEVDHFDTWVNDVTGCKNGPAASNYFRRCTRAQFNAAYQRAKNECEGDFMCDIACSFNPCFLSYIASAMIDCW